MYVLLTNLLNGINMLLQLGSLSPGELGALTEKNHARNRRYISETRMRVAFQQFPGVAYKTHFFVGICFNIAAQ